MVVESEPFQIVDLRAGRWNACRRESCLRLAAADAIVIDIPPSRCHIASSK